jgi:hypothetical protein
MFDFLYLHIHDIMACIGLLLLVVGRQIIANGHSITKKERQDSDDRHYVQWWIPIGHNLFACGVILLLRGLQL